MNGLLSPEPHQLRAAIGVLRMIIGALLLYHGLEVFDAELMKGYQEWDQFKSSSGAFMVYLGKGSEFVAGLLLMLGFLTRLAALLCIGTLGYITFFVGQGKFWYEDQHPFMFVLFGVLLLFSGPGKWSLDGRFFRP